MTRYEKIKEVLNNMIENMEIKELLQIHNEYCVNSNHFDDYIYNMDQIDEELEGCTPHRIACMTYYSGKFCPAHSYFWYNGYGNLESSDYPLDKIYIDDIADYIYQTENSLLNSDIQDILDETEEEE